MRYFYGVVTLVLMFLAADGFLSMGQALTVSSSIHGDKIVIIPVGEIVLAREDYQLHRAVLLALDDGYKKIVLDLGKVTKMDESGLGEVVASQSETIRQGAVMKLASLSPQVTEILPAAILTIFDIYPIVGSNAIVVRWVSG